MAALANNAQRLTGISWTHCMPTNVTPPSVLFNRPLCAEVSGLGFQKLDFCDVSFSVLPSLLTRRTSRSGFRLSRRSGTPKSAPPTMVSSAVWAHR